MVNKCNDQSNREKFSKHNQSNNSIDILFIRTQSKERRKLFYVNLDAVSDLMGIVDESNEDYRDALEKMGIDYPVYKE